MKVDPILSKLEYSSIGTPSAYPLYPIFKVMRYLTPATKNQWYYSYHWDDQIFMFLELLQLLYKF